MKKDWAQLTKMTGGKPITIERVSIDGEDVAVEGSFELPPLARLTAEDQVFVAVFVKSHGSIKQMEKQFGVSYPTIKSRLNRIGDQLDFVEVETVFDRAERIDSYERTALMNRLERGEIDISRVIEELNKGGRDE